MRGIVDPSIGSIHELNYNGEKERLILPPREIIQEIEEYLKITHRADSYGEPKLIPRRDQYIKVALVEKYLLDYVMLLDLEEDSLDLFLWKIQTARELKIGYDQVDSFLSRFNPKRLLEKAKEHTQRLEGLKDKKKERLSETDPDIISMKAIFGGDYAKNGLLMLSHLYKKEVGYLQGYS